MLVKSIIYYGIYYDLAEKILRFDKYNKLKEIYYPAGSDVPKTGKNTSVTSLDSTITESHRFTTHIYQTTTKFSRQGNALEQVTAFKYGDTIKDLNKSVFLYNDSSQLMSVHLLNENNVLLSTSIYQYQNGKVASIKKDYQTSYELLRYNEAGDLIENNRINLSSDNYRYVYTYKGGIMIRYDYYREGHFSERLSVHYIFD